MFILEKEGYNSYYFILMTQKEDSHLTILLITS